MKDTLGDRMKKYENVTRYKLPIRSYAVIRVDGKAFHTYTKGLQRPFDDGLIEDMNETAAYLCKNIMGAQFAYIQSDEISILITDFQDIETQAWFDNNIQKMVSVAASMATAKFNQLRLIRKCNEEGNDMGVINEDIITKFKMAEFDARIWTLPNRSEVQNYFIWRQQDATRNSISSVAQSLYSHKELNGISSNEKQEMIFQKGINWNNYDSGKKRGRFIERIKFINGGPLASNVNFEYIALEDTDVVRNKWSVVECPIFTEDTQFLHSRIKLNA